MSGDWARRPAGSDPVTLVGAFPVMDMPFTQPAPPAAQPDPLLRTVADSDAQGDG